MTHTLMHTSRRLALRAVLTVTSAFFFSCFPTAGRSAEVIHLQKLEVVESMPSRKALHRILGTTYTARLPYDGTACSTKFRFDSAGFVSLQPDSLTQPDRAGRWAVSGGWLHLRNFVSKGTVSARVYDVNNQLFFVYQSGSARITELTEVSQ